MSSLALQLFVNLNKLIHPQSCAGLGSHYAKQLVDRVRKDHPELLNCADPSNAHTAALSAFALGVGLRELRHEGAHQGVVEGVAGILKTALDKADECLEQLAQEEVHLLLRAHEEYKTHQGARQEQQLVRTRLGGVRGAAEILPLATTLGHAGTGRMWNDAESTQASPLHASDIDIEAPAELSEISQALTGETSFLTHPTFDLSSSTSAEDVEPDPSPADPPPREIRMVSSVATEHDLPGSTVMPVAPAMATLHPVRQDRNAEREFSDGNELAPESIDKMLARRRMQEMGRRQEIPLHAAWEGPHQVQQYQRVRGSLVEESAWPSSVPDTSTYLHSESAPDSSIITRGKKKTSIPPVLWGAPTFLILPPVALFYSGVLWGRGAYGQSVFAFSLGVAGAAGMTAAWLMAR